MRHGSINYAHEELLRMNAIIKNICIICVFSFPLLTSAQEYRSIDGTYNNKVNPNWGTVGEIQKRLSPADYVDGEGLPRSGAAFNRPNPRTISNQIFDQDGNVPDNMGLSDFTWGFGQFIDHDITLFEGGREFLPIITEAEDDYFEAGAMIPMIRNMAAEGTGENGVPREYTNNITAYVDGSNIYGSDEDRAQWLRSFRDGKLKTSQGGLLPYNTISGEFNDKIDGEAPEMDDATHSMKKFFIAGDIRANENPVLIAIHTLFVREHNRLCDKLKSSNPNWDDEKLYQEARQITIAEYQNIVFNEWLPAMGISLPDYHRYHEELNPVIFNEFSTSAFRLGHTLISNSLVRMDNNGEEMSQGSVQLRDAYFNPLTITLSGGIEPFLIGMGTQVQQRFDNKMIDDLRSFLFGSGNVGLDLAAINIMRGRERGVADYNTIREYVGLPKIKDFSEITDDQASIDALKELYREVDALDQWVGMVSESNIDGSIFGELVTRIVEMQFRLLRDADRFYFENLELSESAMDAIRATTMRDIVMNNADISVMQKGVFVACPHDRIQERPTVDEYPLATAVYPNPVKDVLYMTTYGDVEQDIRITLYDMYGKEVYVTRQHILFGQNDLVLDDISDLEAGVYNARIEGKSRYSIVRITKL